MVVSSRLDFEIKYKTYIKGAFIILKKNIGVRTVSKLL